jgi:hypothetical protein
MLRSQPRNGIGETRQDGEPCGLKMQRAAPARRPPKHGGNRQIEKRWRSNSASFTPIEMRMRQDNAEAADNKSEKAERENPVSDANQRRMPG